MLGELGGLPNPRLGGQPELGFILRAIFLTPTPWLRLEALIYARESCRRAILCIGLIRQ